MQVVATIKRNMGTKPATYDELLRLPDNLVGEIIDGELVVSPRPAIGHARAYSVLGTKLGASFDSGDGGPGGWWILFETELHLCADILVPDLSGWRRTRMVKLPHPREPFISMAPDWACEVLSPSTAQLDRVRKLRIYAREQVAHVWLVDPLARLLEVFRRQDQHWMLLGAFSGNDRVRAEPFEALELDLSALWSTSEEQASPPTDLRLP